MTRLRTAAARRCTRGAVAFVALAVIAACGGDGTGPRGRLYTPVHVSAALAGSAVQWLSVEVTAEDIAVPPVLTLAASGSVAAGTITVPAGLARTFTARGYDVEGTLTHRATVTVDVAPGTRTGTALSLRLLPATDAGTGANGDDRVALAATDVSLAVGDTRRVSATVTRADGTAVASPSLIWSTLDPAVAMVSPTGLVTAIAPGTTQIIALSGGGAAMATVVVQ